MARINKTYVCRDCGESFDGNRLCPACGSPASFPMGKWIVIKPSLFPEKKNEDGNRLSAGRKAG